jgi:hypothetical protein
MKIKDKNEFITSLLLVAFSTLGIFTFTMVTAFGPKAIVFIFGSLLLLMMFSVIGVMLFKGVTGLLNSIER